MDCFKLEFYNLWWVNSAKLVVNFISP